ncbi:MAG: hypothetical protein ABIR68_03115 [Ilumatobacteraceae bacterium]
MVARAVRPVVEGFGVSVGNENQGAKWWWPRNPRVQRPYPVSPHDTEIDMVAGVLDPNLSPLGFAPVSRAPMVNERR